MPARSVEAYFDDRKRIVQARNGQNSGELLQKGRIGKDDGRGQRGGGASVGAEDEGFGGGQA